MSFKISNKTVSSGVVSEKAGPGEVSAPQVGNNNEVNPSEDTMVASKSTPAKNEALRDFSPRELAEKAKALRNEVAAPTTPAVSSASCVAPVTVKTVPVEFARAFAEMSGGGFSFFFDKSGDLWGVGENN